MDVELDAFNRNITALAAMTKKTAHDAVREAAVITVQAGAKVIPQAPKNRKIIRAVRRYRRGMEELVRGGRPQAPGDRLLFMIPRPRNRRPIAKSGDRRFWVFETMEQAQDHRAITFRGIGKAGFWSMLPVLGGRVSKTYAANSFLADVPGISSAEIDLQGMTPTITVRNTVRAVSGLAQMKLPYILSRANNRIAGMAKRSEDRLARFREAGGVSYNRESESYE